MLACLRLDGFVRGDHQQKHVDARSAREHVADKSFVSRHIYKTETHTIFFQKCEAQINGDSAAFLFGETIRMRAGQSFN